MPSCEHFVTKPLNFTSTSSSPSRSWLINRSSSPTTSLLALKKRTSNIYHKKITETAHSHSGRDRKPLVVAQMESQASVMTANLSSMEADKENLRDSGYLSHHSSSLSVEAKPYQEKSQPIKISRHSSLDGGKFATIFSCDRSSVLEGKKIADGASLLWIASHKIGQTSTIPTSREAKVMISDKKTLNLLPRTRQAVYVPQDEEILRMATKDVPPAYATLPRRKAVDKKWSTLSDKKSNESPKIKRLSEDPINCEVPQRSSNSSPLINVSVGRFQNYIFVKSQPRRSQSMLYLNSSTRCGSLTRQTKVTNSTDKLPIFSAHVSADTLPQNKTPTPVHASPATLPRTGRSRAFTTPPLHKPYSSELIPSATSAFTRVPVGSKQLQPSTTQRPICNHLEAIPSDGQLITFAGHKHVRSRVSGHAFTTCDASLATRNALKRSLSCAVTVRRPLDTSYVQLHRPFEGMRSDGLLNHEWSKRWSNTIGGGNRRGTMTLDRPKAVFGPSQYELENNGLPFRETAV